MTTTPGLAYLPDEWQEVVRQVLHSPLLLGHLRPHLVKRLVPVLQALGRLPVNLLDQERVHVRNHAVRQVHAKVLLQPGKSEGRGQVRGAAGREGGPRRWGWGVAWRTASMRNSSSSGACVCMCVCACPCECMCFVGCHVKAIAHLIHICPGQGHTVQPHTRCTQPSPAYLQVLHLSSEGEHPQLLLLSVLHLRVMTRTGVQDHVSNDQDRIGSVKLNVLKAPKKTRLMYGATLYSHILI